MTPDTEPGLAVDHTWIAELYGREWSSLTRTAYLLTSSRSTAEEIVQDAFVRLTATTTRVLNPAAYLRTTVVNACRDVHRHQGVVQRHPPPAPEAAIAEHDELFDALARLPWRQQAALVLRFHIDLTEAEIATALGCRPNTVRSIIHRALATLRKDLSE
ncbi:MAG: sigma-70 family RNA polymerase sigma factor [Ilumatobacteraceae bacterium]